MSKDLERILKSMDIEGKTILDLSKELNDEYVLSDISRTLVKIRDKKQLFPKKTFGSCGINPDADPCGDACEY